MPFLAYKDLNDSIEKKRGKWFNAVEEYRLELGLKHIPIY